MNVVYLGAQFVLSGGLLLLGAILLVLHLDRQARRPARIPVRLQRLPFAEMAETSTIFRRSAGLPMSTPSRAPPGPAQFTDRPYRDPLQD